MAVIVALEIGELSSLFPNLNGASYSFVYEAFGSELGFVTGLLLYFSYASAIPVVALGFGIYLASLQLSVVFSMSLSAMPWVA